MLQVGEITITSVIDGAINGPARMGFPDKSDEQWGPYRHHLDADGIMPVALGSFLIRTGDRVMLVDAGGGSLESHEHRSADQPNLEFRAILAERGLSGSALEGAVQQAFVTRFTSGALPPALLGCGVRPEEVTDVVLTHLHADHIGWVSDRGRPYFPNAVVRCAQQDLDFFLGPDVDESFTMLLWGAPSAKIRLAPVLDRIETWDKDCTLAPGIDVRVTPGHTPGSSVVVASSGTSRALMLGDMVHCPVELQDDEWQCIGDLDPVMARKVRDAMSREVAGDGSFVAGSHFPGLRFGRVLPGEATRGWVIA
jgi:glyoxylase-like metal-dependent hydrolase (beta-lactamase superfamily II)